MNTAAKDETTSGLLAVLPETRVRGVAPKNTTAVRPESWVGSTLRWGSWQVYDRTAVGRLVGLDYFGARYFSGAQGRFTSPDSTAYSKISNPQSWNLYAYSFNNPLRFTDPTGHEVQAAECKTEQDCQKTLAAVRASLSNGQAAARVGIQPIQRGFWGRIGAAITGAPQFRFTISGDTASFRALGQNASRFADLVGTSKVVYAAIGNLAPVPGGSGMMQFAGGVSGTTTQKADPPFAYIKQNPSSEDPDTHGIIGGHFGIIPGANQGETMAHELLGHVWGEMFGGNPAGAAGNLHDSLDAENAVRATDPSRGLKIYHQGERVYTPQEVEKMRKRQ